MIRSLNRCQSIFIHSRIADTKDITEERERTRQHCWDGPTSVGYSTQKRMTPPSQYLIDYLLSAGLRCGITAAHLRYASRQQSGRTASPSQHAWSPGFCCGWPRRSGTLSRTISGIQNCYYKQLQALVENVVVFSSTNLHFTYLFPFPFRSGVSGFRKVNRSVFLLVGVTRSIRSVKRRTKSPCWENKGGNWLTEVYLETSRGPLWCSVHLQTIFASPCESMLDSKALSSIGNCLARYATVNGKW